MIVGRVTTLDFDNNADLTVLELGGGYLWHYSEDLDVVSTLRIVNSEAEVNGVSADDNGFALSAGVRALLAPQFEIRGSINHVNLDNSDTYLKLAGDYHFNEQFSAGASLEFAGDADTFAIGARWFFK